MLISTTNLVCALIVAFLFGVVTAIIATPKPKKKETIGSLVVDMTEPYDPGLYLQIETDDVIYDIVKNNSKTVTLDVNIYGE